MRIIDKIEKIGEEKVKREILDLNVNEEIANKLIDFIKISGTTDEKISKLDQINIENETYKTGVEELKTVVNYIRMFGMPEKNFTVDFTIARGLDYYTGTVYETFLNEHRDLGSVCSGGRYENLAENYTNKKLPGVGISIGLTRLFFKLNEKGLISAEKKAVADVIIVPMSEDIKEAAKLATELRNLKINTEIYLENKKMKAKIKYADKLKIPYLIVIGEDEIITQKLKVKNMETGKEEQCAFNAGEIKKIISKNQD